MKDKQTERGGSVKQMISLLKDITVCHSVMSWNDIASVAYSTEPQHGQCVLQYKVTI